MTAWIFHCVTPCEQSCQKLVTSQPAVRLYLTVNPCMQMLSFYYNDLNQKGVNEACAMYCRAGS